jgi:peptidoglycan lytic transglycosylase
MKLLATTRALKKSLSGALVGVVLVFSGCAHKPQQVTVPPAPSIRKDTRPTPQRAGPETQNSLATFGIPADAKPLLVETGVASWYGAPYHNRRGSNGEIYNMYAMTAAHRTLPLGSVVRVTNPANGAFVLVRITDRGPFIAGRVIDLSQTAAKQIGLIQKGTAPVRVEVLKTPTPIDGGGRWAVQIGGFEEEQAARDLAGHLSRRYHTAKVLTFDSPAGDWWVRVRVKNDMRARAEEILRDTKTREGGIFLVRLD